MRTADDNPMEKVMSTGFFEARFAGQVAYTMEGDWVRLNADLEISPTGAHAGGEWLLQLWADPIGDADGWQNRGVKLAELQTGQIELDNNGYATLDGTVALSPPAGQGDYVLSLVLAQMRSGEEWVLDQVRFESSQSFVLPRMEGDVAYRIDDGQATVSVDTILNPREIDNLSGTLSLELWAMAAPYAGGAFSGFCCGAANLGQLQGQACWAPVTVTMPLSELPDGEWILVLMLREWSAQGAVTRDYCNFSYPVSAPLMSDAHSKQVPAETISGADATAETGLSEEVTSAPAPLVADDVSAVSVSVDVKPSSEGKARRSKKVSATSAEKPNSTAKTVKADKTDKPVRTKASAKVSINQASVEDLVAVPGLNARLAAAIVAGRPWKRVNDLVEIRGISDKLLDKIYAALKC